MTEPAEVADAVLIKKILEDQRRIGYLTRCSKCGHHEVNVESEETRNALLKALEIARHKLSVIVGLTTDKHNHVHGAGCVAVDGLSAIAHALSEL